MTFRAGAAAIIVTSSTLLSCNWHTSRLNIERALISVLCSSKLGRQELLKFVNVNLFVGRVTDDAHQSSLKRFDLSSFR